MEREDEVVAELGKDLQTRLGEWFDVHQNYLSASMETPPGLRPDLVIWPKTGARRPYIVEIKLMDEDFDLPLATAGDTLQIANANKQFAPVVILATSAKVSPLLKKEFDAQHVYVVKFGQAKNKVDRTKVLASDLYALITKEQKRAAESPQD